MKILVIGHSVMDCITSPGNKDIRPGGICFTVPLLKSVISNTDEFYLCTFVSDKKQTLFSKVYSGINSDFIFKVDSIPVVNLNVNIGTEREEEYENIIGELPVEQLPLETFDAVLINMITGFDINLDQLRQIRKKINGIIYFDVHTLSRGLDENLKREFRIIPKFEVWAECIDILQANESEIKTLFMIQDETLIIKKLLSIGIQQVIITRAEKGASVYFSDNNSIIGINEAAIKVNALNKIGCGDVFGAVYFYNYIRTKSIEGSLKLAVKAAGKSTTYIGINDYYRLKDDISKGFY